MKINVTSINPRNESEGDVINVLVHISDSTPSPERLIRNAEIRIFVSKNKKTIEEINQEAVSQALMFLSEIVAQHNSGQSGSA